VLLVGTLLASGDRAAPSELSSGAQPGEVVASRGGAAGGNVRALGLDDTLERRRGIKIAAKGIYRDPVRSSQSFFVRASGLRWRCLRLLGSLPWAVRGGRVIGSRKG